MKSEFNKPFLKSDSKYLIVAPGTGAEPKENLQNNPSDKTTLQQGDQTHELRVCL
jgi:hypothetical protein